MKKVFKKLLGVLFLGLIGSLLLGVTSCGGGSKTLKIGVPDDGTNQSRAIKLLETAGLIEVDPAAGYTPELKDVTKYIYNIEIVPTKANTLPSLLEDYAACIINGTYAAPQGLIPSKDALIIEKQDSSGENPYVNIIAARTEDKDNATYKTIVSAFQTELVAKYLLGKYNEVYFPAFTYDNPSNDSSNLQNIVSDIDTYTSTKASKTVVKVGVCGAANAQWKAVQKVLDDLNANIYIELVEFSAYNLPNEALNSKDIDLNSFQHKAYLNKEISDNKYNITAIGDTLIAPLSLYSKKYTNLDQIKETAGLK